MTREELAALPQTPQFLSAIIYDCAFPPDPMSDPGEDQRFYFSKEDTLPDGSLMLCFSGAGQSLNCATRSFEGEVTVLRSNSSDQITIQQNGAALLERFEARWDNAANRPSFAGPLEESYEGVCRKGAAYPNG